MFRIALHKAIRAHPLRVLAPVPKAAAKPLSSSAAPEAATSSSSGLLGAVAATFGTYMLADFLSNFLQHPTQQVRRRGIEPL